MIYFFVTDPAVLGKWVVNNNTLNIHVKWLRLKLISWGIEINCDEKKIVLNIYLRMEQIVGPRKIIIIHLLRCHILLRNTLEGSIFFFITYACNFCWNSLAQRMLVGRYSKKKNRFIGGKFRTLGILSCLKNYISW